MPLERWLYAWRARWRALFDRGRADRELDDELRDHVARETAALRARGIPPAEARRQALASLGGLASAQDRVRAVRFGALAEQVLQDVRHGLRLLVRNPGFTAATVITLTVGIGATTTVFSVVDAVLLQPPPFPEPGRLVTVWQTVPGDGDRAAEVAPANFLDWRAQSTSFEHVAAVQPYSFDATGAGQPEVLYASLVTEGFFRLLGAGAAVGRTFRPDEYRSGSGVVVLTDGLWQRRYGGDPVVVGETIVLDGAPHTVVGVLAPDFELALERGQDAQARDLYAPKAIAEWETFRRGDGWWQVVARLRTEASLASAQAEMDTVAARIAADHPRTNEGVGARVIPLRSRQVEDVRPTLLLLQGFVVLVLLIACLNVASLMLAQSTRRTSEFAVRAAVGGGRGRLLRQLLTESAMLAALGGAGGLLLAAWTLDLTVALMPADVPRLPQIGVNGRLLAFAAGLVAVTTVAFGSAPALHVLRRSARGLLREQRGGAGGTGLHRVLVTAEVALALVLLVGAGLLAQSFARLVSVDLGFAPANTVALQVFHYPEAGRPATADFFRRTLQGIRALPGVTDAGAVSSLPIALADITQESVLTLPDRPPPPPGEEPQTAVTLATPGYFEALGIPLRAGRWFEERDDTERPRVAVVNETLARQHWPDADPLDARVTVQLYGETLTADVVGVVGAVRPRGFDSPPRPEVFLAHAQLADGSMTYVVRTEGDPAAAVPAIQDVVWTADPLQAFYSIATIDQLLADTLAARRFTTTLVTLFGLVALALATLGIYGVIAVATAQRTHEMGLRMALGAAPGDVRWMVVRGAVGLAGAGVAVGLLGSIPVSQSLTSLLVDVAPFDVSTLAAVSSVLLAAAAAAAWIPARRAAATDPLAALRVE
ncbi:MAG: ABC transporter permease [Acidobacteria bacterium]|nr:ABC transporter permease [Acidobacteriota bacterium]